MFPQLGAPAGLILSAGTFWFMWNFLSESQRFEWGWRIPFIASVILVIIGLWVRLSISETPEFKKAVEHAERVKVPLIDVFVKYPRALFLGSFAGMTTFVLFYLCSAYLLSYSTHHLNLTFGQALEIQMVGAVFFGLLIPFSGKISDRIGRRTLMIWVTISMTFNLAGIVGASFAPYIAETLVQNFGTAYIGYYLLLCSFISLTCFVGFTDKEISR